MGSVTPMLADVETDCKTAGMQANKQRHHFMNVDNAERACLTQSAAFHVCSNQHRRFVQINLQNPPVFGPATCMHACMSLFKYLVYIP